MSCAALDSAVHRDQSHFRHDLRQALPRLADDLEYRFMGRDLIIRDGRTNLIVDYLPDVMTIATGVTP